MYCTHVHTYTYTYTQTYTHTLDKDIDTHTHTPYHTDSKSAIFPEKMYSMRWLLFGGYYPHKQNISNFLKQLIPVLDGYLSKFDNYLLIGDLNSEVQELALNSL